MTKDIEYTIDDKLIIRKFYGDVTIIEFKASLMYMLKEKMVKSDYIGIISDFSEASFNVKQEDLLLLKDIFMKNYHLLGHLQFAQIIPSPQIAQAMRFENDNKDIKSKSFSTFQAAERWILHD